MHLDCVNCVVRSWRRGDAADLVEHANNRAVWLQLRDRFPHPYTLADARRWLRLMAGVETETNFAITVDDRAVGAIGFEPGRDIECVSAEIGYWLGEAFWGRGIATAALRMVTPYAFDHFPLERLFARVFSRNEASLRVLEKAGYVREGLLRRCAIKDGVVLDQVLYAIIREDWTGQPGG
jgi:RimJ/RimL family protein N-acetyltransferase